MPTTDDRAARIRAAAQKVAQSEQTPKNDSRGTIGEFLRSRNESLNQDTGLFNIGSELVDSLKKRGQDLKTVVDRQSGPDQMGFVRTGLRTAGALAGGVADVAGAALKGGYRLLAPKALEEGIHNIGQDILNSDIGQSGMEALSKGLEYWDEFANANPDVAKDIESVVDIASFLPNVKAVTTAAKTAGAVGKTIGRVGVGTVRAATKAPGMIKDVAESGYTAAKDAVSGLRRGLSSPVVSTADDTAAGAARAAAASETVGAGSVIDDVAKIGIPEVSSPPSMVSRAPTTPPIAPRIAAPLDDAADPLAQEAAQNVRAAVQRTSAIPPASAASKVGETAGRFLRDKKDDIGDALVGAKERIAPNVARKASEKAAVKALDPQGQKAVRSGILRRDVEAFTSANDKERDILKSMVKAAEDNTNNRGTTHPSDLVGKEMNRRIKLLDDERKVVGKELGEQVRGLKDKDLLSSAEAKIAGKMGNEAGRTYRNGTEVVQDQVIKRLDEVPGLEGIKMGEGEGGKAVLDFTDTALSGSQSKAARDELQALFDDITGRNPYQLHRLRQEIFESLGGKKAAQLQLTETQEQGMDAIREGIADALELASDGYKAINAEYRSLVTPLKEMRKFYKGTEGAAEDVLDAKAGLLARRLTSNVASAPELRRILDEVGAQLAKRGQDVSDVDLNKLQDFYNALNRYYDITKDTTFEGLIKSANANPTEFTPRGIARRVVDAAFENTYITKDTQRAALKELLDIIEQE